jgi:hypothetical protein
MFSDDPWIDRSVVSSVPEIQHVGFLPYAGFLASQNFVSNLLLKYKQMKNKVISDYFCMALILHWLRV